MAYKRKELYRAIAISGEGDRLTLKTGTSFMKACVTAETYSAVLGVKCFVVRDNLEREVWQIVRYYLSKKEENNDNRNKD